MLEPRAKAAVRVAAVGPAGTAAAPPDRPRDLVQVPLGVPGHLVPAIPVTLQAVLEARQVAPLPPTEDQTAARRAHPAVRAARPEAQGVRAVPRVVRILGRPAARADLAAAQVVLPVRAEIAVMATETVAARAAAQVALRALPMIAASATEV